VSNPYSLMETLSMIVSSARLEVLVRSSLFVRGRWYLSREADGASGVHSIVEAATVLCLPTGTESED
jgi:hypothetical protein